MVLSSKCSRKWCDNGAFLWEKEGFGTGFALLNFNICKHLLHFVFKLFNFAKL